MYYSIKSLKLQKNKNCGMRHVQFKVFMGKGHAKVKKPP
jgi:hypothetical protein